MDSCACTNNIKVYIQENGIIRLSSTGLIIGRLEDVTFEEMLLYDEKGSRQSLRDVAQEIAKLAAESNRPVITASQQKDGERETIHKVKITSDTPQERMHWFTVTNSNGTVTIKLLEGDTMWKFGEPFPETIYHGKTVVLDADLCHSDSEAHKRDPNAAAKEYRELLEKVSRMNEDDRNKFLVDLVKCVGSKPIPQDVQLKTLAKVHYQDTPKV